MSGDDANMGLGSKAARLGEHSNPSTSSDCTGYCPHIFFVERWSK